MTKQTRPKQSRAKQSRATQKSATQELEEIMGGPLTLGDSLRAMRECSELSQVKCAELLAISRSHLCDVEKGRKIVTPEKAHQWATALAYPPTVFVQLALQAQFDRLGLNYTVALQAA